MKIEIIMIIVSLLAIAEAILLFWFAFVILPLVGKEIDSLRRKLAGYGKMTAEECKELLLSIIEEEKYNNSTEKTMDDKNLTLNLFK